MEKKRKKEPHDSQEPEVQLDMDSLSTSSGVYQSSTRSKSKHQRVAVLNFVSLQAWLSCHCWAKNRTLQLLSSDLKTQLKGLLWNFTATCVWMLRSSLFHKYYINPCVKITQRINRTICYCNWNKTNELKIASVKNKWQIKKLYALWLIFHFISLFIFVLPLSKHCMRHRMSQLAAHLCLTVYVRL